MRVEWTAAALKGLRKVPGNKARALIERIERVAAGTLKAKPLQGELAEYHSVRLSDFRAIIRIEDEALVVTVVKVGPRSTVYE